MPTTTTCWRCKGSGEVTYAGVVRKGGHIEKFITYKMPCRCRRFFDLDGNVVWHPRPPRAG